MLRQSENSGDYRLFSAWTSSEWQGISTEKEILFMPTKKVNVGQENTNDKKEWYIKVPNYGNVFVSKKVFTTYYNSLSKERIKRKQNLNFFDY